MKVVPVTQLVPGMVSAQDILSKDNSFILRKGAPLTCALIMKLELNGVISVAIEKTKAIPQDIHSPDPFNHVRTSKQFKEFRALYTQEVDSFKENLNSIIKKNSPLDVESLIQNALSLANNAKGPISIFDMLHNMHEFDDSTYSHCMNVGLISYLFAGWLKMSREEAELVTACGLLHDLGKLLVDREIIQKPDKLTDREFEEIKKHPDTGYRILKKRGVNDIICQAALMHHERCDGSGYPNKFTAEKIHPYAKIIAIADVYDAMTSTRVYRGPMCPFRVIEIFEEEGFQKYDTDYILTFLENIVTTFLTSPCQLNDGRHGTIVFINKMKLSCPTVKCGEQFVDLGAHPELYIERLL